MTKTRDNLVVSVLNHLSSFSHLQHEYQLIYDHIIEKNN